MMSAHLRKHILFLLAMALLMGLPIEVLSQNVGINNNGSAPDNSAMLDVSATDQGVLLPRTDTTSLNGSGMTLANGLLIYQTSDDKFYYFTSSGWVRIDGPDTDDQQLSFSSPNLSIDDGNTVDLSPLQDGTGTDDQQLNFTGSSLSIEDGNSVNLSSLSDGTGTDDQQLSFSSTNLSIEDGNSVDLSTLKDGTGTDDQNLTFSGTSLSIEDGNSVNLSSLSDGTGTDDQKIDVFDLSKSTLSISLESDGESSKTVDLSELLPIGTIVMYPGSTAPDHWLICNGSIFSASDYPDLNTLLGGNTLPDFSGRFPLAVGNSGTSGSSNHSLGSDGGEEEHTLTTSEMPSHTHGSGSYNTQYDYLTESDLGGTHAKRDGSDTKLWTSDNITGTSGSTGGGNAHNNMPPYITVNFIIKGR